MARRDVNGACGWLILSAYIFGYDTWAISTEHETLSSAFARTVRHPVRRWPTLVAYGVVTLHLFDHLPERFDPFVRYGKLLSRASQVHFSHLHHNK